MVWVGFFFSISAMFPLEDVVIEETDVVLYIYRVLCQPEGKSVLYVNIKTVHSTIYAHERKWVSIYHINKALCHNSRRSADLLAGSLTNHFQKSLDGV